MDLKLYNLIFISKSYNFHICFAICITVGLNLVTPPTELNHVIQSKKKYIYTLFSLQDHTK